MQTVANTGALTGGSAIAGEFTYRNTGTAAGTQTIYWSAYYSTLATLNGTNEVLIATGTAPALAAATTSPAPVPFSGGTWPAAGGSYYLIVRVGASDSATTDEGPTACSVSPPSRRPTTT